MLLIIIIIGCLIGAVIGSYVGGLIIRVSVATYNKMTGSTVSGQPVFEP